ncbi:MAG: hypothetical protein PHS73_04465 [Candidatus Peribacteraceae bacterium]|nr:hypothetical protein [Candidatus Peribacteraceae bacterium]
MADAKPAAVQIPDELKQKFPELIELVLKSESMNDEERQYWINILPVMTPEQVQNLKDILVNEREQLAAIDRKYAKEIEKIGSDQLLKKVDDERRKRREDRSKTEDQARLEEAEKTADILGKIQGEK